MPSNLEDTNSLLRGVQDALSRGTGQRGWNGDDVSLSYSLASPHPGTIGNSSRSYAWPPEPVDDRLTRENTALRGALGDAVRRLAELEGEKERFISEDVFDLVNSLCRDSTGGSHP
jgi:hypothetical protein